MVSNFLPRQNLETLCEFKTATPKTYIKHLNLCLKQTNKFSYIPKVSLISSSDLGTQKSCVNTVHCAEDGFKLLKVNIYEQYLFIS